MLKKKEPFLIGVAGGISSGKSTVCKKIIDELAKLNSQHPKHVMVISLDSFYKVLNQDEIIKSERGDHNFDHPSAFDDELAYQTLTKLIEGKTVEIPIYEKKKYKFSGQVLKVTPDMTPDVLILEGILVFYYPKIRELCQMKLFVDCDADTRLSRRVLRDMNEYDRPLEQVLSYYQKYVKPAFEEFCLPTKKYADVIIPRGAENSVAINLIVQHLNDYLNSAANQDEYIYMKTPDSSPKLLPNAITTTTTTTTTRSQLTVPNQQNSQSSSSLTSHHSSATSSPSTPSKRSEVTSRPH